MSAMASQITGVSIVYSTFCSGTDQRKHQSSASLAFMKGIHRWPVYSPHKGPVTRKMFPFDNVDMAIGTVRRSVCDFDVIPTHVVQCICRSCYQTPWWRHQTETFSALLAICVRGPVTGEFPAQRPVTRSFDAFFDLRLNELLSKQSFGWWFETPSHPLWRHSNDGPCSGHVICVPFFTFVWFEMNSSWNATISFQMSIRASDSIVVTIDAYWYCSVACPTWTNQLVYYYSGTCIMRPGKSCKKHTNVIICMGQYLQNHV